MTTFREFNVTVRSPDDVIIVNPERHQTFGRVDKDPLLRKTILVLTRWLGDGRIDDRIGLELLGNCLYHYLLDERMRDEFEQSLKGLADDERLRLVLEFHLPGADDLARLPWEYLYFDGSKHVGRGFVAGSTKLVLSRHVDVIADDLTDTEVIKMLFVAPQDDDARITDPDGQTLRFIQELASELGGGLQLKVLHGPVDKDQFSETMAEFKPHLLHFLGHGQQKEQIGQVQFRRDPTEARHDGFIDASTFGDAFETAPRLVVLQACDGAKSSDLEALSSVALELVRQKVPAVVGFNCDVEINDAHEFCKRFYQSLVKGNAIDEAVEDGRRYLATRGVQHYASRAFGSPVVYLQRFDLDLAKFKALKQAEGPADEDLRPPRSGLDDCPNPQCDAKVRVDQQRFCSRPKCGIELEACDQCGRAKDVQMRCPNCNYYADDPAPAPAKLERQPGSAQRPITGTAGGMEA